MKPTNRSLPSLKDINDISADDLIEKITAYLQCRPHSSHAKVAAEQAVFWFAHKRWKDYCFHDVRARMHRCTVTQALTIPLERISAVTACMNRNVHILDSVPTWIASKRFEEIIIVDYGSIEPLEETLGRAGLVDHPSMRLIRIEAEKWCLAEAFNTGLFRAQSPFTIKLDADTLILGRAEKSLRLSAQEFRTGNWRTFANNVLNGIVLAPTDAIQRVGGYNEQIRRYGWDDCDFYERLSELFLIKTDLLEREFRSLDHSDDERVAHSDELAKANDINRLIQGNRVLANLLPKWTDKGKRQFAFHSLDDSEKQLLATIRDFAYRVSKIQDNYIYSEDSTYGYSAMLRDIASHISKGSGQQQVLPSLERAPVVLMVSLYEDRTEARRREMIRCLRINTQIFDKVIVLYEQPAPTEAKPETSIADELKRLSNLSRCEKELADIEIVSINQRPAFCDFFELSWALAKDRQKPWFVIANADIAFDCTIERIHELDNSDDVLVWLSRWDKCSESSSDEPSETYLDPDGSKWALITSISKGSHMPNYLSADAWIYKRQPDDWDKYTYKLGTYFCDSFFANRAFLSNRPVINPCRSIRCFHHHVETINSSAEKFEDKEKIEQLHSEERARLGGEDPVAGVQWSTLEICNSHHHKPKPYRWNPKGGLWLHLGHVVNTASTLLVIEAALKATEASGMNVFINLQYEECCKDMLSVALEFEDYLCNPRLFLDLSISPFNPSLESTSPPLLLSADCPVCLTNWDQIALNIITYLERAPHAHHSDRTHLQLLQLLTIDGLYTASFLSSRHPELFQQLHSEAAYATQLARSQPLTMYQQIPRFSLITSLFRAEKYLHRLLENYEAIASLGPCELVIVDVNRDSTDREIVESFMEQADCSGTIQYIQLQEDPGIYGCWMKAISIAHSPLVSNFNADDRRSAVHPHLLANYLENHPDIDVCCTALKATRVANLSWYEHYECETWFQSFEIGQIFDLNDFKVERNSIHCSQNIAHCMPMWRKSIHDQLGPIREDKYGTSADWAFWLQALSHGHKIALASNNPLGLYYISQDSHNRRNDQSGHLENRILKDYYGIDQVGFLQQ